MWTNSTVWRSSSEWSLCQLPLCMYSINYKGLVALMIISCIVHFTHVSVKKHDTSNDVVVVVVANKSLHVCHKSNNAVSNGTVLIMRYY